MNATRTLAELEQHWKTAFSKPENHLPDKLERALTGSKPPDPTADPLFLTAEQADERERIFQCIADFENSGIAGFNGQHDYIVVNGERYPMNVFLRWRHRMTYELLVRNVEPRAVAAAVFATVDFVLAVAAEHGIQLN